MLFYFRRSLLVVYGIVVKILNMASKTYFFTIFALFGSAIGTCPKIGFFCCLEVHDKSEGYCDENEITWPDTSKYSNFELKKIDFYGCTKLNCSGLDEKFPQLATVVYVKPGCPCIVSCSKFLDITGVDFCTTTKSVTTTTSAPAILSGYNIFTVLGFIFGLIGCVLGFAALCGLFWMWRKLHQGWGYAHGVREMDSLENPAFGPELHDAASDDIITHNERAVLVAYFE